MSQYYLVAQLPSLDAVSDNAPLPITEERFLELCERFLDGKTLSILKGLTLSSKREQSPTGSGLVDAWYEGERALRLALGSVRAARLKKSFDLGNESIPPSFFQAAKAAVEASDPFQAEKQINKSRLELLESLRPMDAFSDDAVLYYGLKLKLLNYVRQFDRVKGEESYRTIYNTILANGLKEVAI